MVYHRDPQGYRRVRLRVHGDGPLQAIRQVVPRFLVVNVALDPVEVGPEFLVRVFDDHFCFPGCHEDRVRDVEVGDREGGQPEDWLLWPYDDISYDAKYGRDDEEDYNGGEDATDEAEHHHSRLAARWPMRRQVSWVRVVTSVWGWWHCTAVVMVRTVIVGIWRRGVARRKPDNGRVNHRVGVVAVLRGVMGVAGHGRR